MSPFYLILLCVIGLYVLLIFAFIIGFDCLDNELKKSDPKINFSIIIPFRNEAKHLLNLLNSIKALVYDDAKFEVLLVNDDSSDDSVAIIEAFKVKNTLLNIQVIDNNRSSNSPKKDAISTAIKHTKHAWVISTDADCILPNQWLNCYNDFINMHDPNMIIAPVSFNSNETFLQQFQLIDFLSMQGTTIGGFGIHQPFMANAANFGYKKDLFLHLNGFENNNDIASGDDVFLLENFIKHNKRKVLFLKNTNALVTTFPTDTWSALINQRKRWAAKATHFKNPFTKFIGIVVFLANFAYILALLFTLYNIFFIEAVVLKIAIDSCLIYKTTKFYHQKIKPVAYLKTVLSYPFFTAYIAVTSMLTTFEWKDRAFRK